MRHASIQTTMNVYGKAMTLRAIAADPLHLGTEIGLFAVLHTWGSNLLHHPHVHCVVPGGGLSPDGTRWIACRPGFFLPVRVLSRLFRRLFLEELAKAFDAGKLEFFSALEGCRERGAFLRYLGPTREVEWVVYAKRPFAGPEQVLDYVGHYPLISEAGARCRRAVSEPAQEKRNAVTGKTVSTRTGKCQTAESVAEFFEPSSQHLRCFGP